MFGLVALAIAALYLGLMFVAVRFAWRHGLATGGTSRKAFGYSAVAFLLVYLPVFWDHIPTLVVYRYHCTKDAGFTAYVDAKDWHVKNAEAVAAVNQLPRNEREASLRAESREGFEEYVTFGGLLRNSYETKRVVPWLTVGRTVHRVTDARTGELLAAAVDYGAGGPGNSENLRSWLSMGGCFDSPPSSGPQSDTPTTPIGRIARFKHLLKGDSS